MPATVQVSELVEKGSFPIRGEEFLHRKHDGISNGLGTLSYSCMCLGAERCRTRGD